MPAGCSPLRQLRDTARAMSQESTTPDLVELGRVLFEAANRKDFAAARAAAERLAEERG
jgi:hypothetical protein